jgi:7tm Chemosensory receptor
LQTFFSAYETIRESKTEIILSNSLKNENEELFKIRRETIFSILDESVPLNGKGFFEVNNSTVTGVIGAAITYIVVLLQFSISEQAK